MNNFGALFTIYDCSRRMNNHVINDSYSAPISDNHTDARCNNNIPNSNESIEPSETLNPIRKPIILYKRWLGNQRDRQILDENIKAYKIVKRIKRGKFQEIFYKHWDETLYEVGKSYNKLISFLNEPDYRYPHQILEGENGIYCYSPERTYLSLNKRKERWRDHNAELHSFKMKALYYNLKEDVFVLSCDIPKGTEIYINDFGAVISECLTVKECLTLEDAVEIYGQLSKIIY